MISIRSLTLTLSHLERPIRTRLTRVGNTSVFLLLLTIIAGCEQGIEPPPIRDPIRPVKTFVVPAPSLGSGSRTELPGRIRAPLPVDLAFTAVSGRVVELPIAEREGQEVLAGQLLAQVDPRSFEANLRNAENSLGEAYSVLDLARAENERMERMKEINANLVSASMLERTRTRLDQAEADIDTYEDKVKQAEALLEHSSLRAPFAAVVTRCLVENAQQVKAGEPVVSLRNISHLEILVDVPEWTAEAARQVNPGSIFAIARFPAAPDREFPLKLKEAADAADPTTGAFRMVLEMPKPEGVELAPGVTGAIELVGDETKLQAGPVLVPAIAVMTDPNGADYIWLVDRAELRVHRLDVQIGRLAGSDKVQIVRGLTGGERIVVAGVTQLSEDQQVRLWNDRETGESR